VPFILNKPICGRGWILFLDEVECLPFVEVGDFRATGLLAEQPEEDFRAPVQNWRQRLNLITKIARKTAKIEQKSNLIK
jgi:hypothetical protein